MVARSLEGSVLQCGCNFTRVWVGVWVCGREKGYSLWNVLSKVVEAQPIINVDLNARVYYHEKMGKNVGKWTLFSGVTDFPALPLAFFFFKQRLILHYSKPLPYIPTSSVQTEALWEPWIHCLSLGPTWQENQHWPLLLSKWRRMASSFLTVSHCMGCLGLPQHPPNPRLDQHHSIMASSRLCH